MKDAALPNALPSSSTSDSGATVINTPSLQPAQTRLSFDIWLMLSRGTAAGHRKQSTGKTVTAWVVSDSSSCCATIGPFRIWVSFLSFPADRKLSSHTECKSTHCSFIGKVYSKWILRLRGPYHWSALHICMHMLKDFVDSWKLVWFVGSVNKNAVLWNSAANLPIISDIISGFCKAEWVLQIWQFLKGASLIITKCPNTPSFKSPLAALSYCNPLLLPGQPQPCRHGSCGLWTGRHGVPAWTGVAGVFKIIFGASALTQMLLLRWSFANKPRTTQTQRRPRRSGYSAIWTETAELH